MLASKKKDIDGLKGVACLLIMLGHFSGLYKYAQNCSVIDAPFLRLIPYSLIAEGFWLRLFYVLSGYLVSRSGVATARDLERKAVVRFFRLALPIFGTTFYILLFTAVFGIIGTAPGISRPHHRFEFVVFVILLCHKLKDK